MAFFVAIVLLHQHGYDWKWYVAAVVCQMAHMALLDYRFRELERKVEWSRAAVVDTPRGAS